MSSFQVALSTIQDKSNPAWSSKAIQSLRISHRVFYSLQFVPFYCNQAKGAVKKLAVLLQRCFPIIISKQILKKNNCKYL